MATFGAWLSQQEHRGDGVGEMARYWSGLKGERRIRALPSIENELKQRGDLAAGSPVATWWVQTLAEYRAGKNQPTTISGSPVVQAVPDLPEGPSGDSGADLAAFGAWAGQQTIGVSADTAGGLQVTHVTASLDQLGRIEAKLDWLYAWCGAVNLPLQTTLPPWPQAQMATAEPIDWRHLAGHADYDATQEGG
jgi:hypothetical protein